MLNAFSKTQKPISIVTTVRMAQCCLCNKEYKDADIVVNGWHASKYRICPACRTKTRS